MALKKYKNRCKHVIQLPGPNKEITRIHGHETVVLSDYYDRYCPKYLFEVAIDHYKAVGVNKKSLISSLENTESKKTELKKQKTCPVYRLITAITTYNRVDYLKRTINTWNNTRNKSHMWTLVVSDDGSDDSTMQYLQNLHIEGVEIYCIQNNQNGVHHQNNQILRLCQELDFDYGFKIEDDIIFKKQGWDDKYIEAIQETGFHHLVHYDRTWGKRRQGEQECITHESRLLECHTTPVEVQGTFWTFTPDVIQKVGFFDIDHFNLCGYGHTDYTLRCCRVGFNDINNPYDIANSNNYIELVNENYKAAPNKYRYTWNSPDRIRKKRETLKDDRTYVPYNNPRVRLDGSKEPHIDVSFIIPLRGREDHIRGLFHNLQETFNSINYEIVFSIQDDDKRFRRGQLCNLGFMHSVGDVVVFQDVDIRHLRPIDFVSLCYKMKRPFVAFDSITQLQEDSAFDYKMLKTDKRPYGFGACAVFTRQQFIASHGFSNLIVGWGGEDNLMHSRANFLRLHQSLGHVQHDAPGPIHNTAWYQRNHKLLENECNRSPQNDSMLHTIAERTRIKREDNVTYCYFSNITVPPNFYYAHLMRDIEE